MSLKINKVLDLAIYYRKLALSLVKIHQGIISRPQGCSGERTVALIYPFATSLARGNKVKTTQIDRKPRVASINPK